MDSHVHGRLSKEGEAADAGGAWVEGDPSRNRGAPMPITKRQSVSRGELRAVLWAQSSRRPRERLVVPDSEGVRQGIVEVAPAWLVRLGAQRSVGVDADGTGGGGQLVQLRWVPSHLGLTGVQEADKLAERGRLMHPHYEERAVNRPASPSEWQQLGFKGCLPDLPLAPAGSDMIKWSRVLLSHTLDAARSY